MTAPSHQLLRKARRALLREAGEQALRDREDCAALAGASALVDALRRLTVYLEEPAEAGALADEMLLTAVELWQVVGRRQGALTAIGDLMGRSAIASPAAASAAARGLAS